MAAAVDSKKSTFRCIDAVRYVVALVVTVLTVSVIVNAIKVVLRPDVLHVSVIGSSMYTQKRLLQLQLPPAPPTETLTLYLNIRAQNPSGRARMYYLNIVAHVFDNKTLPSTPKQDYDSMVYFNISNLVVAQKVAVDSVLHLTVTNRSFDPSYFKFLFDDGGQMSGVTLRLDGELVTEVKSGLNKTSQTTYFCDELFVGGDPNDDAFKGRTDAICNNAKTITYLWHVLMFCIILYCVMS